MRLTDALRERNQSFSPQDRFECPLGRLAEAGKISKAEYEAGVKWRTVYLGYLQSIGAPEPYGSSDRIEMSDEDCEHFAKSHKRGCAILNALGKRVFHAVNAIAVYEEPETLGDFAYTTAAAKKGLAVLAREF